MESNLFIKSYKAEGNKITDIEFYGDWELETGNAEGEVTRVTVKGLPDDLEVVLDTDNKLKIKNNGSSTSYYITRLYRSDFNIIGSFNSSSFMASIANPGKTVSIAMPNDTKGHGERFLYIIIRPGSNTTTIKNGGIVAYLKAGIKDGTRYIEGV